IELGAVLKSPNELTILPSESYSRTGGAGVATNFSLSCRSPRLTSKMWSWASTQMPPARPVTMLPGKGFGQLGSTSYFGTPTCACAGHRFPTAIARPAQSKALPKSTATFFIHASLKSKLQSNLAGSKSPTRPKPALWRRRVDPALYSGGLQVEPAPVLDLQPAIAHAAGVRI